MDFTPNEEHQMIRDSVRKICSDFTGEYWAKCDNEHKFPWEFHRALAAGGWAGVAIPEQYGGAGLGVTEAAIVLEEVAASGAAINGCTVVHGGIFGMEPVVRFGSEEMKQRILPRVAAGELHIAFGVTEPNAGVDTSKIITRARREGDHYIVNGAKVWTSKALESDKVLLLVRTKPAEECRSRFDGLTLLLADLQVPEVTITPIPKGGRNAVASCETVYDNLRVPVADIVGKENEGFKCLLPGLNAERILVAAEAVGTGRAALDKAVAYAKERIVFDRPIGKNQAIAHPLAKAYARLKVASLAIQEACWRIDNNMSCGEEANIAKYMGAEAGFYAADRAMQTLGGYGMAEEYGVVRYWREVRIAQLGPVPQEMILNYIAEHVLELPRSY
ncbi:MAG: acyl-CoA/acyl-ACP dehydrogenase [Proteobacteria bacterium]|nr:acyl-CoA/acyl-ACP dehydrogenase [Pseudomonadota bacterium]